MKNKLIFLVVLPLVWFGVAMVTLHPASDRIYVLSIAPSAWLHPFVDIFSIPARQLKFVGLPTMFLVGLILLVCRAKPKTASMLSIALTMVLLGALGIAISKWGAVKAPGAACYWLLCCFNFSLCLLPFFFMPAAMWRMIRRRHKASKAEKNRMCDV